MRQLQCLQHQHLFSLSNLASRQGKHDRGVFFNPFPRLVYRGIQHIVLIAVLFFPRADTLFCRRFIFDPLKRRDIQGIDRAYGLRRTPLAVIMLFLHSRAGAFALRCRMLQRRAGSLLFGIPLLFIVCIIAAVAAQPGGAQLKNTWHLRQ